MALFDTMCDLKSISTEHVENVKVTAPDEVTLLYNWLECLLLKFELEHKVFSKFKVTLDRKLSNRIQAIAKVYGENYEKRKHGAKVEVKAVTLHRIEKVVHSDDAAIVRVPYYEISSGRVLLPQISVSRSIQKDLRRASIKKCEHT